MVVAIMSLIARVFGIIFLVAVIRARDDEDLLVDPASRTLQDFKDRHPKPIGVLTTSSGSPVDVRNTNTFTNANLLTNAYFFDNLQHVSSEKVTERAVSVKGTGAHGYFEVLNDVTMYTKAKLFEKVGKKTPLFARFGPGQIDKGATDAPLLSIRTMSFKMYTEEGNLDFLNIQTPVFPLRSPAFFPLGVHSFNRKNTKNHLIDKTSFFDHTNLKPEPLHWLLWAASEFGLPRGFRYTNAYPIHTYELYNNRGESFFVRFKFLSELGYEGLSLEEAQNITATDPDMFVRDLYNAIEMKDFPSWRLEMDVLTEKQVLEAKFNPFDIIRLWPNGTYHTVPIGRVVTNRNVENFFREVELSAFNPANLVPGIRDPPDMMFKGRVIGYITAQTYRLGVNHNKIPINCPLYANTYNRDGLPPVGNNMKDAPSYYPNSFNGPQPYVDDARPTRRIIPKEEQYVDFDQHRSYYRDVLKTDSQKKRLIDCLVNQIIRVMHPVQQKFAELLSNVDEDLARRFRETLATAKETMYLPAFVTDIRRDEL